MGHPLHAPSAKANVRAPVVGDDDERVHVLTQGLDAVRGLVAAAAPLKGEWVGHDTDGQHAGLARQTRHHRRGARASAPAHARRDESLQTGIRKALASANLTNARQDITGAAPMSALPPYIPTKTSACSNLVGNQENKSDTPR